jgi:hypothetical protein
MLPELNWEATAVDYIWRLTRKGSPVTPNDAEEIQWPPSADQFDLKAHILRQASGDSVCGDGTFEMNFQ